MGAQYRPGDVWMVDLDVLIPLEARARAAAAFASEGWPMKDPVGGPPLPGAPGAVFARPFTGDAISALDVDVHWRVAPVERLFPWRGEALPDEVWRCAVSLGPAGLRVAQGLLQGFPGRVRTPFLGADWRSGGGETWRVHLPSSSWAKAVPSVATMRGRGKREASAEMRFSWAERL